MDTGVVYPTEPQNDIEGATKELIRLIKKDNINMIAIGNGTASRESEMFVSDVISRSICLFSFKTCNRRVSRFKRIFKRCNFYSKTFTRSFSRTCKNRSKGNRRWTISARCRPKTIIRKFNGCSRRCS